MGVRRFGGLADGPAFEDVLRIGVSGPVGLYLMVVDLPSLISVPNEGQMGMTSERFIMWSIRTWQIRER